MQALHDIVQAGYARYIGMSSCYAWQFQAMQNYAINNRLTPFISMQNNYSMLYREEEREMMPTLKYFGVGSIPWSPLARGLLARPLFSDTTTLRQKKDKHDQAEYLHSQRDKDTINRVEEVAKRINVSMAQVALAWLMAKEGVTAPIVGTTSLKSLSDLIGAVNITLTKEDIAYLDELYQPKPLIGI